MSFLNLTLTPEMWNNLAEIREDHSSSTVDTINSSNPNSLIRFIQRHLNQTDLNNETPQNLIKALLSQFGNQTFGSGESVYSNYVNNNGIDKDSTEHETHQIDLWIKVSFYVIYVLICTLGIAGNAIVCFVVARNSTMHTVTNVFIANLALSDILLCIFAVPFTPLYLIAYKTWVFGTVLCHLVPFAQGVSVYISTFTLMSIAIDRYFVILYPFKPRMQMKTCVLIIIAIWIAASILTLPYAHFMELLPSDEKEGVESSNDNGNAAVYYCDEHWPDDETRKTFGISTSVTQFVIPFIIITLCYVRICGKLWERANTIPGNVSARREEQERERTRKTNGMLISMVIIFVVSWLPLNIHNLLFDFYIEAAHEWKYQRTIFLIVHAIAMSSTCYNPFLYAWLNDNFRKEFKLILPCCAKLKRNLSTTLVELRHHNSNLSKSFSRRSEHQNSIKEDNATLVADETLDGDNKTSTTTMTVINNGEPHKSQIALSTDSTQNMPQNNTETAANTTIPVNNDNETASKIIAKRKTLKPDNSNSNSIPNKMTTVRQLNVGANADQNNCCRSSEVVIQLEPSYI